MGLGGRHLRVVVRAVRDPVGRARRSHRSAQGAHAHRAVVVGVHQPHRTGVELLPAARHALRVRHGRGGRVPERVLEHLALVPAGGASACAWHRVDGEPRRRRADATAGRADRRRMGMAHRRSTCSASSAWCGPWPGTGGTATIPTEMPGVTADGTRAHRRLVGPARAPLAAMGAGRPEPELLGHPAHVPRVLLGLVLLRLLDADLPAARSRVHRRRDEDLRDAAVRRGRARQPHRGIGERRAGAPARPAQRPAVRRRGGAGGVGPLPVRHGGGGEPAGRRRAC